MADEKENIISDNGIIKVVKLNCLDSEVVELMLSKGYVLAGQRYLKKKK
jgi:hypothetical protein